jgi:small subunit ribosomal protein S20
MPIIKSAKKRLRQSIKKQKRNYQTRSQLKTAIKSIGKLVKEGKLDDARGKISKTYKIIDLAAKKNIIHKRNASRKKSSITLLINRAEVRDKEKTSGKSEKPKK